MIPLTDFLLLGALLFSLGAAIAVVKKNAVAVLMGVELMLNAVNINLVAFNAYRPDTFDGNVFALFIIAVAAAESVTGLALILKLYHYFKTVDISRADQLKG